MIIAAGSNDINIKNNINGILVPLIEFSKQNYHTNIIMLNIPHRYDLGGGSHSRAINDKISKFNIKLKKLQNTFSHVKILETTSERSYYSKHGLHFNDSGRELVAGMICELI